MGVILTTYKFWDDPPSRTLFDNANDNLFFVAEIFTSLAVQIDPIDRSDLRDWLIAPLSELFGRKFLLLQTMISQTTLRNPTTYQIITTI